ncbi:hypothetical protein K501DRAFT_274123 [Backusella circina FSU 941]|nr:hypothetical protein K501DRAFT_274123 [Backusella circina FSU 941]
MVDIKRIPSLSMYGISDDIWLLSCKFTFQTRQKKKTRTSHGVNFIHDPLLSKDTDFTMAEHGYLSIRGLVLHPFQKDSLYTSTWGTSLQRGLIDVLRKTCRLFTKGSMVIF